MALTDPAAGPRSGPFLPRLPARVGLEACQQLRAQHDHLLASIASEIESRAPLPERFSRLPPNEALAGELRTRYEKRRGAARSKGKLDLECRGDICRLGPDGSPEDELFPPPWVPEGKILEAQLAPSGQGFMAFADPGTKSGMEILNDALRSFRAGGAKERCVSRHPDEVGILEVTLTLSPPRAEIVPVYSGPMVGTPIGLCMTEALSEHLLQTPVDAPFTGAVLFVTISLPAAPRGERPRGPAGD